MEKNRSKLITYLIGALFVLFTVIGLVIALNSHRRNSQTMTELQKQQAALAASPQADPILKYLPYGDIGYNITPEFKVINSKSTLVLNISVILSGADYKLDPQSLQAVIDKDEQAALNYIQSVGFDPSKYQFEYAVPSH